MSSTRKKKTPRAPARTAPPQERVHLGLPTPERAARSNGFDRDDTGGGTVRSRARAILTPPAVRREMIAEAIRDLRLRGKFEIDGAEIRIRETPADRLLNPAEHEAICWFIAVQAKAEAGRVKIASYGQRTDKGDDRNIVNRDFAMHAELAKVLPEPHLVFLEWLSWHENPGSRDGVPPDKIAIGKQIIDSRDSRRAEGGVEGFLRAVAQNISHWRGEIETMWRRRDWHLERPTKVERL